MSITAVVENDMIRLPIHVPDGTKVEVSLANHEGSGAGEAEETVYDALKDFIGKADGLPADFAAEHDHYLHGTAKQSAR